MLASLSISVRAFLALLLVSLALAAPGLALAQTSPAGLTAAKAFGYCGDYVCNTFEDCSYCQADCGQCECGNGIAVLGEECDTNDLKGETCESMGYDYGELQCADTCTIDQSECDFDVCSDSLATGSEECDDEDFRGETCQTMDANYDSGELTCTDDCEIDLSHCYDCGDGMMDPDEECDGNDFGGETCEDYGYDNGDLYCNDDCTVDYEDCYDDICGDNEATGTEACDGNDFRGEDCTDYQFDGGDLICTGSCTIDPSDCYDDLCGDSVVQEEEGEECDDGGNINNDGCSASCQEEYCGDGITNYNMDTGAMDECDNGIDNSDQEPDACRTDCTEPYCGDAIEDSLLYKEECDDGNQQEYDGCFGCEIEQLYCCTQYTLAGVPSQVLSDKCVNSRVEYDPFTCEFTCDADYCAACGYTGVLAQFFCPPDFCSQLGCVPGQPTVLGWIMELLNFPWNLQSSSCEISPLCPV